MMNKNIKILNQDMISKHHIEIETKGKIRNTDVHHGAFSFMFIFYCALKFYLND